MTIHRRRFLRGCAATGAMALVGAPWGVRRAAAQDLKTIRVTQFGGPFQVVKTAIGDPFEAARQGRVIYEVENSVSALTKLQAQKGNPPFNIVMFSRAFAIRAGKAGLLTTLTLADVPGLGELSPDAMVPGGFGLGIMLDSIDIAYDTRKVSAPITSWLDLGRADLKGQVVMPAAALPIQFIVMQIARSLGGSEKSDKAINDAFAKLKEMKANVRTFYSDPIQATQMIERGDVAVAVQFGIRTSHIIKANPHIARASPEKEGVPGIPYDLCITQGSDNQDVARRYVNFAVRKESQEGLVRDLLATPVHKAVAVPADLKKLVVDLKRVWFPDEEYAAAKQPEWSQRWTREVQS
ncbi:MAG: extracellular solute-binding protein [Proteobacteria bacterium]|nr:extracellular solute-binding protein [Pseudomonadota bacterium]